MQSSSARTRATRSGMLGSVRPHGQALSCSVSARPALVVPVCTAGRRSLLLPIPTRTHTSPHRPPGLCRPPLATASAAWRAPSRPLPVSPAVPDSPPLGRLPRAATYIFAAGAPARRVGDRFQPIYLLSHFDRWERVQVVEQHPARVDGLACHAIVGGLQARARRIRPAVSMHNAAAGKPGWREGAAGVRSEDR